MKFRILGKSTATFHADSLSMPQNYKTMTSDDRNAVRILVIGKSGNGKSSLCNAILGEDKFAVGRGMSTTTVTAQCETVDIDHKILQVIDTPDITNCDLDANQMREEVMKWRQLTKSRPTLVLLAVRCDVRYTAEEFAIYNEIMKLWGNNWLKDRLVVAFTFHDRQDQPLEEELKTVCPELKRVLKDAKQMRLKFDKTSEENRRGLTDEVIAAIQGKDGKRPVIDNRQVRQNVLSRFLDCLRRCCCCCCCCC